jgi:exodeoxyribonuclease VII large subunit
MDKAQRMDELDVRLGKAIRQRLERSGTQATHLTRRLTLQSPARRLANSQNSLKNLNERLATSVSHRLDRQNSRLEHLAQTLNVVSPLATLGRGYAIVQDENGGIIRDAGRLETGDLVSARVATGRIEAKVTSVSPDPEANLP